MFMRCVSELVIESREVSGTITQGHLIKLYPISFDLFVLYYIIT